MARKLNLPILAVVSFAAIAIGLWLHYQYKGDWWEFAGFVTGVVGVYLVAVEHIINWPVGLANVSIYGWVFFQARLFADMSLQVFFFALGVMGWIQWAKGGKKKDLFDANVADSPYPRELPQDRTPASTELKISRIPIIGWGYIAIAMVVGTAIYVPIITHFNGAAPFVDSVLTVASIIAQLLLNAKKLENWILWIIVDIVYIPLYISRHLEATAVLYFLLLVLATSGLIGWLKTYRTLAVA